MDAIEYLKAKARMCVSVKGCRNCPLDKINKTYDINCFDRGFEEEAAAIVEKWAELHPVKTRQSEFLKLYPNVAIKDGAIKLCPFNLNVHFNCRANSEQISCNTCRKEYWLKEVEE